MPPSNGVLAGPMIAPSRKKTNKQIDQLENKQKQYL
jgi:hypothetical protein